VRGQRIKCKGKSFKDIIINRNKQVKRKNKNNNNNKKPNGKGKRKRYKKRNYGNRYNKEPPKQNNIVNAKPDEEVREEEDNKVMEINTDSHQIDNKYDVDVTQNIHNIHVNNNNNWDF